MNMVTKITASAWSWIAGLVILAIVGLAAAYFSGSRPVASHSDRGTRISIKVAESRDVATTLVHVALANGYFAAEGLDVEAREYPSGKRSLGGLFAGEVDFATPAETPLVFSSFERSDFRVVASIATTEISNRIAARRDHGIERPADLRGKRIATQKASAAHYFLHLLLLKHGLSTRDVQLSFLQPEELPAALARGEIDAIAMREPYISEARQQLGEKLVIFVEPGIYQRSDLLVVRAEFARANPVAVQSVLRALLRAEEFVLQRPQAAVSIVTARTRMPEEAVASEWPGFAFRLALPQSLLVSLDEVARWAQDSGLIEGKTAPNYLELVHLDALSAVQPAAVTVIH